VTRTRDVLGDAIVELMQELPFEQITVQQVLDRAGVARSTFYMHYREKDDLFLSEADEFFKLKKRNTRYRNLTFGQLYLVIGIEADEFRILNDAGRPFLYPPTLFSVLDSRKPGDWVTEIGDDGERYSYPPPLNKPGFFEDFFDQKTKAVATFRRIVNRRLAASSEVA